MLVTHPCQAVTFTYNAQGLRTGETFPDGTSVQFSYDAHQNPIAVTDPTGPRRESNAVT